MSINTVLLNQIERNAKVEELKLVLKWAVFDKPARVIIKNRIAELEQSNAN